MRILASARDVGAAGHVLAVAQHAQERGHDVRVVAAPPALAVLQEAGLAVRPFLTPPVLQPSPAAAAALLQAARDVLVDAQPDALVVGLSHSAEAGLDEALLACAGSTPTYALQDFWGDVNDTLGCPAQTYFVVDEQAAQLTRSRHGAHAVVVGSPKHARYAELDVPALAARGRALLGLAADRRVVGYFGQPLLAFAGYGRTVEAVAAAFLRTTPDAALLYRPHPREDAASAARTCALFRSAGVEALLTPEGVVETWLASCDVVLAPFSTCCYDALYLNRLAPGPQSASVYLLFDPEVRRYSRWVNGMDVLPPVQEGMALAVTDAAQLDDVLRQAVDPQVRLRLWQRVQECLPDSRRSAALVVDAVESGRAG